MCGVLKLIIVVLVFSMGFRFSCSIAFMFVLEYLNFFCFEFVLAILIVGLFLKLVYIYVARRGVS